MVVVAVDHLLDVLVLVVVAAVADVLLIAGPVADASDNAGTWPGSCHSWHHIGDGAVACPGHPARDAMRPRWCSAGQTSPCRRRIASRAGVATQSAGASTVRPGLDLAETGGWGLGERTRAGRRSRQWQPCCVRGRPVRVNYDWPGQVEAASVSALVGQPLRSVIERAGACYLLQRQGEGRAKGVSRSANVAG